MKKCIRLISLLGIIFIFFSGCGIKKNIRKEIFNEGVEVYTYMQEYLQYVKPDISSKNGRCYYDLSKAQGYSPTKANDFLRSKKKYKDLTKEEEKLIDEIFNLNMNFVFYETKSMPVFELKNLEYISLVLMEGESNESRNKEVKIIEADDKSFSKQLNSMQTSCDYLSKTLNLKKIDYPKKASESIHISIKKVFFSYFYLTKTLK